MKNAMIILLILAGCLSGCKKAGQNAGASSGDEIQRKLQELAGKNAKDCGRIKSQAGDQMKAASDCSMQAARDKQPFFVAYEMPGLTVGVAGNTDGKLFALHAQRPEPGNAEATGKPQTATAASDVQSEPCPSALRVAQSGRVTCFPAGSFGMPPGANPHGGGMMAPPSGGNPHGSMSMPPPGTMNPHGDMPKAGRSSLSLPKPDAK